MLNENIKRLCEERGLTQEGLAEKLHVVRQTISKWECGTSVPDSDQLVMLADIFEVTVDELLGREAKESRTPEPTKAVGARTIAIIAAIIVGAAVLIRLIIIGLTLLLGYTALAPLETTEIAAAESVEVGS